MLSFMKVRLFLKKVQTLFKKIRFNSKILEKILILQQE